MENIQNGTQIKNNPRGTFIPLIRKNPQRLETALNEARKLIQEGLSYDEVLKSVDSRVLFVEDIDKLFEERNKEGNSKTNIQDEDSLEANGEEVHTENEYDGQGADIIDEEEQENMNDMNEMFIGKHLEEKNDLEEIDINNIYANEEQARKEFNESEIVELASSIKRYGLLSPIIVSKEGDHYIIVAGERRWRACKSLNFAKIKCRVIKNEEKDLDFISLIENFQRKDLNPIEKAFALNNVMSKYELTQEELAEKLGKARSTVTNILRILNLDSRVLDLMKEKKLAYNHCKILLQIKDPEKQYQKALDLVKNDDVTSDKIKEEAKQEEKDNLPPIYIEIEQKCQKIFGDNLKFQAKPKSKSVSFKFKTDEELEKFLNLLKIN